MAFFVCECRQVHNALDLHRRRQRWSAGRRCVPVVAPPPPACKRYLTLVPGWHAHRFEVPGKTTFILRRGGVSPVAPTW